LIGEAGDIIRLAYQYAQNIDAVRYW
jgi:hypothetical protein